MRQRAKFLMVLGFACIFLSLTVTPSMAASCCLTFSQQVGDEYIWEVSVAKDAMENVEISHVGDRLKIQITLAEYGSGGCCAAYGDMLYGNMYNSSVSSPSWNLFKSNTFIAIYNLSSGYYHEMVKFFIPHNETVVNLTFYTTFTSTWNFSSYSWTSGVYGYDGLAAGYNGSSLGDINQTKKEYKFNAEGVAQYYRVYNGTGSGWELIYSLELQPSTPIPGFFTCSVVLVISSLVLVYATKRRIKNNEKSNLFAF